MNSGVIQGSKAALKWVVGGWHGTTATATAGDAPVSTGDVASVHGAAGRDGRAVRGPGRKEPQVRGRRSTRIRAEKAERKASRVKTDRVKVKLAASGRVYIRDTTGELYRVDGKRGAKNRKKGFIGG